MAEYKNRQRLLAELGRLVRQNQDDSDSQAIPNKRVLATTDFDSDIDVNFGHALSGLDRDSENDPMDPEYIDPVDRARGNTVFWNNTVNEDESIILFGIRNLDSDRFISFDSRPSGANTDGFVVQRGTQNYQGVRMGDHFDSDFSSLVLDSFRRKSFSQQTTLKVPGSRDYNPTLEKLANEMSIENLFDVNNAVSALIGETLVWNGDKWTPGLPTTNDAEATLRIT